MSKKVKVKYNANTTITVTEEVWDLCEKTSYALLESTAAQGTSAVEKTMRWYADVYKGGVGEAEARKIMRKSSLFYLSIIQPAFDFIKAEVEKKGVGKRPKKEGNDKGQAVYNSDFVDSLCLAFVHAQMKKHPEGFWSQYQAMLKKKYGDKDRVLKRLTEKAQNNGYIIRAALKVLEDEKKLPKAAFPKVVK